MNCKYHILLVTVIGLGYLKTHISAQCIGTYGNGTGCFGVNSNGKYFTGMWNSSVTQKPGFMLPDSKVSSFLQCVGLPVNTPPNSQELMSNLKALIEAASELFSLMRSTFSPGPMESLSGAINVNPQPDIFSNVGLLKTWLQIKLRPLLSTISWQFLSCLSTRNFTCEIYQILVQELSEQVSIMDPVRQKWIYNFFIYPFLAGNSTGGCVAQGASSKDWLVKNLGAFSSQASFKNLRTLNIHFNELEVLHLLTRAQKAELLLYPELNGPDQLSRQLVFDSLINPLNGLGGIYMTAPAPLYQSTAPSAHQLTLNEGFRGFLQFLKPVGSITRQLAALTQQANFTSMKSTTVVQAVLNWTLAELAGHFRQGSSAGNGTTPSQTSPLDNFDITNFNDWFLHVVLPTLQYFNLTIIPDYLNEAFYQVFSLNATDPLLSAIPDLCPVTLVNTSCILPNTIENVVNAVKCMSHINLTFTEENVLGLIAELSSVLHSVVQEFSTLNFSSFINGQFQTDVLPAENLSDVSFVTLWFQMKLQPQLSTVSPAYLSCLSTKNFSCHTFQALVLNLSDNISVMDETQQKDIYSDFIYQFLSLQAISGSGCTSQTTSSEDWLTKNFGKFSVFAILQDFYRLNKNFSALETLNILSPNQTAELIVFNLEQSEPKNAIVSTVFSYLLESPIERNLPAFLDHLVMLSQKVNVSCDTYNAIFSELNQALLIMPVDIESVVIWSKRELLLTVPPICTGIVISENCLGISINGTQICNGTSSSPLNYTLGNGNVTNALCNISTSQYACASMSSMTALDLYQLLTCKIQNSDTSSKEIWMLFFTQVNGILNETLDLYSNMTSTYSSSLTTSNILDAIAVLTIDKLDPSSLEDPSVISLWFQGRLRPFLPSASDEFLYCLSTRNLSCETFQAIVQILSSQILFMDPSEQQSIYVFFIHFFLLRNDTTDPGCVSSTNGTVDWLQTNLNMFLQFASFADLQKMNANFSVMDALPLLTVNQLAQIASTPGQLESSEDVNRLMSYISDTQLASFFDSFTPIVLNEGNDISQTVRSALLQQVFNRGILTQPSTNDSDVLTWYQIRLQPLFVNLSAALVAPYFDVVTSRSCATLQQATGLLNSLRSTLQDDTQTEIYNQIVVSLQGPAPLHCYQQGSFYSFLEGSFLQFQFPNLSTILTLIPEAQKSQLINSLSPVDLGSLLNRPDIVSSQTDLCTLLNTCSGTPDFLQTQVVPYGVRPQVLACVWPSTLRSNNEADVNAWFDQRLAQYLQFLNMDLISSTVMLNASCLSFQKFVSVLGNNFNYSNVDFSRQDVYETIKSYLSTGSLPKCYNANDPVLNSTAWFVNYIGMFIGFITLDDLHSFGSSQLVIFVSNIANIQLFNQTAIPQNVSLFYTTLLYEQDSNFNPLLLPLQFRCSAPGGAYTQLNSGEVMVILQNLNNICGAVNPQVSAALAGNLSVSVDTIEALGQNCVGFTAAQLLSAPPSVLLAGLGTLSNVTDWNQQQAMDIIQVLLEGNFQITDIQSLLMLGTLIQGVPSQFFTSIQPLQLLGMSQSSIFITNILNAPNIIQYIFVNRIISINNTPDTLLLNVPDAMATQIPRSQLGFSPGLSVAEKINMKSWTPDQAVLFFDMVASELNDSNNISVDVLQGFTCTGVQAFTTRKVINIIKACRSNGINTVVLKETQLTCMYNFISRNNPGAFSQYPVNLLLYYNYQNDVQGKCTSYFAEVGMADITVISDMLSYIKADLLQNAQSCLNISGTNLSKANLQVMGNLVCALNGTYIVNSDPLILENLKNCQHFTVDQVVAMETFLLSGKTPYRNPSTWNVQTLQNLGILPLYLTSNFWSQFTTPQKIEFLGPFLTKLRLQRTSRQKLKNLFHACNSNSRSKRSAGCTAGNITTVTINSGTFPFGYDVTQFNDCLPVQVVVNNLGFLANLVDDDSFQRVILDKLNQAYPSGLTDELVQLLSPISGVATLNDISKWGITTIDTLSALMSPYNGAWTPDLSAAIITKYLSAKGNVLGTAELNSIGGANLCGLDASVLGSINSTSLRNAGALDISNCSLTNKKVVFTIASNAFQTSVRAAMSKTVYQLIQPYLGGAPFEFVELLCASNVSMDIDTFIGLDINVILNLTVMNVSNLLGLNLPQLKTYENVTVIRNWISLQYKSALSTLHLDLTGGIPDPTAAPGVQSSNTVSNPTVSTTKSGASRTTTDSACLIFSTSLVFAVVALFMLH